MYWYFQQNQCLNIKKHAVHNIHILAWGPRATAQRAHKTALLIIWVTFDGRGLIRGGSLYKQNYYHLLVMFSRNLILKCVVVTLLKIKGLAVFFYIINNHNNMNQFVVKSPTSKCRNNLYKSTEI